MATPTWGSRSSDRASSSHLVSVLAALLLALMAILAGGSVLRESATVDEVTHIGAGVSYWQKLDLRMNEEHPPLPKVVAALPLVIRGTHADYSNTSWTFSSEFIPAFIGQWPFGELLLEHWNDPASTLKWARFPMLLLTLLLGWVLYRCAARLGGSWGGLLCLAVYVSAPLFLAFGPLVHTDIPVTLFVLLAIWMFAEVWRDPSRKNVLLFALCLAGALLSKFSSGILFFALPIAAFSTRWRLVPGQSELGDNLSGDVANGKPARRVWRRLRWRATLRGVFWAALCVYAFYFVFSRGQSTDILDRLGHGSAFIPLRRLLMPPWIYLRRLLMFSFTASRPTFILGHHYPHGVWFYFPVLFLLKSPLGFLGLLVLALVLVVVLRRMPIATATGKIIPQELALHWRTIWISLMVFTAFCLASRLDISFRHFSVPFILMILMLAPLPRMVQRLGRSSPFAGKLAAGAAVLLVASSIVSAVAAYPYYFPFVNALSFGRPVYALVNDSNVDWNQVLPEVKRFAESHRLQTIELDSYGLTDSAAIVPQSRFWDCQKPTEVDNGQWVAISANMILDAHNCTWLMQYPHDSLAGGGMYAVHLPEHIPAAGAPGGPPLPADYRFFPGFPNQDSRIVFIELARHPETLPKFYAEMMAANAQAQQKAQSPMNAPGSCHRGACR